MSKKRERGEDEQQQYPVGKHKRASVLEVGAIGLRAVDKNVAGALPTWQQKYNYCQVMNKRESSVKVRLLTQCTDTTKNDNCAHTDWIDEKSNELHFTPLLLDNKVIQWPPKEPLYVEAELSDELWGALSNLVPQVDWGDDCDKSTRYLFGNIAPLLQTQQIKAQLLNLIRDVCKETWGGTFWNPVLGRDILLKAGHFLRYDTGHQVPPLHLDVRPIIVESDDAPVQQVANVLIYLNASSSPVQGTQKHRHTHEKASFEGGQTVLLGSACTTQFPKQLTLDMAKQAKAIIVTPKCQMVVWRSFASGIVDPRASHTALPVTAGTKYALCLPIVRPLFD